MKDKPEIISFDAFKYGFSLNEIAEAERLGNIARENIFNAAGLTETEKQVLHLEMDWNTMRRRKRKEIANEIGRSVRTVGRILRSARVKLNYKN